MKLWLHIGTPAAGGRALRGWLADQRAALADHGIFHPKASVRTSTGDGARLCPSAARMTPPSSALEKTSVLSIASLGVLTGDLRGEIDRAAEDGGVHSCVVSGDHLWGQLGAPGATELLHDFCDDLDRVFDTTTVVVHLRPQVALTIGHMLYESPLRATDLPVELAAPDINPYSTVLSYDRTLARWEEAFGAENIVVLPVRRIPDPAVAWHDLLGLESTAVSLREARPRSGQPPGVARSVVGTMGHRSGSQLPMLELAEEIQRRFEPLNDRLVARRAELEPSDLAIAADAMESAVEAVLAEHAVVLSDYLDGRLDAAAKELERELHHSRSEVERLRARVENLVASTSWKATEPLRALGRVVKPYLERSLPWG